MTLVGLGSTVLALTPFALVVLVFGRSRTTHERLLAYAIRLIRDPAVGERRGTGVAVIVMVYSIMFGASELGRALGLR